MVAFIITVRFIVYFCIGFIVENNVIDKGEMPKYLFYIYIYIYIYIYVISKYFPRIVGILSYVLCSELIRHFCEVFNVTLGVPNAVEISFVWWRRKRSLQLVWRTRQFMKLNSFIFLTYHLSDDLKIRHKLCPMTYTNQKF